MSHSANSFGSRFVVTTFGESHGPAMGVVIDGCPAGVPFDGPLLLSELRRRRPGQHGSERRKAVSDRKEPDIPELLSGVYEGHTLGTPIAVLVRNRDARPSDYDLTGDGLRPGHADDVWKDKFGHADLRGGGRASGRETVSRVIAGAIARMFLREVYPAMEVAGSILRVGPLVVRGEDLEEVEAFLRRAKVKGEGYGGIVQVVVDGAPAGLGQPVFGKLKSDLAGALMGVGAAAGVEIGAGWEAARSRGSAFHVREDLLGRRYGGLRGGISTGERIVVRVAFKPPASLGRVAKGGRHDPCIVTRALPVIEAMTWLVLADHVLWMRGDRLAGPEKGAV